MKNICLVLILLIIGILQAGELENLQERTDIIIGHAENENIETAEETALNNLFSEISKWYLDEHGLLSRATFTLRDRHTRMTAIWLAEYKSNFSKTKDKDQVIFYYPKHKLQEHYHNLVEKIHLNIETALIAKELNKPGIYMRNLYWSLILIDLVPGDKIEIDNKLWDYDQLVKSISETVEDLVVRLKSNDYHLGMRRLLFHVLLDDRPVNDVRLGIVVNDSVRGYSMDNRDLQVDLFGHQFEDISNLTLKIDLQDELTGVWGKKIREIGDITGMSGFEAFRTIPLGNKHIKYHYWDELEFDSVGDSVTQKEIEKNITGLLESIEYGENRDQNIFSSNSVKYQTNSLLNKMKILNLVTGDRIKFDESGSFRYWRGFRISVMYGENLVSNCNLVIKTDRSNRISGVWLGMKPLDYRLIRNNWQNEETLYLFLEAVEEMERKYTANILGRNLGDFKEKPEMPNNGWKWAEIENVEVKESSNAAVFKYDVIVSGLEKSWSHRYNGIKGVR